MICKRCGKRLTGSYIVYKPDPIRLNKPIMFTPIKMDYYPPDDDDTKYDHLITYCPECYEEMRKYKLREMEAK